MDVSRIYIDSSTLIGNGWPMPGAELRKMLGMSQVLRVAVYLPDIVEAECEAEWLRRLDVRSKQITGALDSLASHTRLFQRPRIDLPSVADAGREYRELVAATKTDLGISTSTLTARLLGALVIDAAHHAFPFPSTDTAFRDAVILLSVMDDIEAAGEPLLAFFVSDDTFFSDKGGTLPSRSEIRTFVKDLKGVNEALTRLYTAAIVREWTDDAKKLKSALEHDKVRIIAFLTENLSIPIGFSFFGMRSVKAVRGLTLKAIGDVSTSFVVPSQRQADAVERISFKATVIAHESVEQSSPGPPTPNVLRVGQEIPPPEPFSLPPRQVVDVDVDLDVVVEADAHIVGGEYVRLAYVSVKLSDGGPVS